MGQKSEPPPLCYRKSTTEADALFAELELSIAFAKLYYQLQVNYKRRKIAEALVDNQNKSLKLTLQRQTNDLDNQLIVQSAEINVTSAKQALLQIEAEIAIDEHQLKAYLARHFDEMILDIHVEEIALPEVPLPRNLPLHLLAYRPDITAKLWLIESQAGKLKLLKLDFIRTLT